jgi:transcription elongation factor GreA-like protein
MDVAIKILRCRVEQIESYLVEGSDSKRDVAERASALAAEMGIRKGSFVQIPTGERGRVLEICQRGRDK